MKIPPFTEHEAEVWAAYHERKRRNYLKRKGPKLDKTLLAATSATKPNLPAVAPEQAVPTGVDG